MSESYRPKPEASWNRTISRTELEKLKNNPLYEEPTGELKLGEISPSNPSKYGIYKDRHVIGRDEKINQGVYLGSGEREEIVVDDINSQAKESYDKIYSSLWQKIQNRQKEQEELGLSSNVKNGILSDVFELVMDQMRYDGDFVSVASKEFKNQKINLSYFIDNKKGVCRHQALMAGYLLERLKNEGYIDGDVSIDRNSVPGRGAHAWVRYKSATSGVTYIIDPAQNWAGRLDDAPGNWPYQRPEDQ